MNSNKIKNLAMGKICMQAFGAGLMILLAGCASPDPRPFQQYAAAVKEAGDGLDNALAQDINWSREKYINSVLDGSTSLEKTALLDESSPFTVTFPASGNVVNQPTFYKLQDVRVTLLGLNDATEKYVNVATVLAGSDLVNPDAFESMAKDADASLNSITRQLDAQVPGNAIHLFSVGSAEIARLVIEQKRKAALEQVLMDSQAGIDGYCQKCLSLLRILDQSLLHDYSIKSAALEDEYHKISKGQPTQDPNARACVEELLQLNSDYLALVDSLKSAKKIYETLPEGHRELLKSVQKQPTGFEAIGGIYEEGKRLERIYGELNQTTTGKTQ